jgi:hypothetical protein
VSEAPDAGGGCSLAFRTVAGCLEVRASGRMETLEEIDGFFVRIGRELQRCGAREVLILDGTRSIVPDASQFEQLVASLAGVGFEGVRIAFVDVRGDALERIEIGEIIARSHGHALRVFDNEALARLWLRYTPA